MSQLSPPLTKECVHDILTALQIKADTVVKEILSLKDKARKLICDWLHQFCRTSLSNTVITQSVPCHDEQLREAFIIGGALMRTDSRDPRWHLLYVDTLLAKGGTASLTNCAENSGAWWYQSEFPGKFDVNNKIHCNSLLLSVSFRWC